MSIINEALKKAGNSKEAGRDKSLHDVALETQKKSKAFNWGPIFVLLVLAFITGPLIAPVFSTTFKRVNYMAPAFGTKAAYQVPADKTLLAENPGTRKAQFGMEEMPLSGRPFAGAAMPRFTLTGIMFSQPDAYCIINGQVLRVGDALGEAKVISVEAGEAKLLYRGEEIRLSVPE